MRVNVSYFKRNGKWYTNAMYTTNIRELQLIWDDLKERMDSGKAPGLIERPGEPCGFIALVDVPRHPYRHPHIVGLR